MSEAKRWRDAPPRLVEVLLELRRRVEAHRARDGLEQLAARQRCASADPVANCTRCSRRRSVRYALSSSRLSRSVTSPRDAEAAQRVERVRERGATARARPRSAGATGRRTPTSRMPPGPSFRSRSGSEESSARPRTTSSVISRAMRGSTTLRQTKGERASSTLCPKARSPATGRARRSAARSQVRPQVS